MNEEEFWAALAPQPAPPPPIYRLYHDELGNPLFYSMEDVPGNYIDIDHETYATSPAHVRVVDGKLIILKTSVVHKLKPGETGVACDHQDICVVVDESHPHTKWSLK
jgi:hypothetical protein